MLRSRSGSPGNSTCNSSLASSRASSPEKGRIHHLGVSTSGNGSTTAFNEQRFKRHRLCLGKSVFTAFCF